jgi:hypothetical protein
LVGTYFAYSVFELNHAEKPMLNGFMRVKSSRWTGEIGFYKVTDIDINRQVRAIAADDRGNVYIGGTFTTPYERIAKWNGSTFEPVGGGLDDHVEVVPMVRTLKWMDDVLYVSGEFERSGSGQEFFNRIGIFDTTEWHNLDIRLPGFAQVRAIEKGDYTKAGYSEKGVAYFGMDTAGTAYVAMDDAIDYEGTAPAYPTMIGLSEFAYIKNNRANQVFELLSPKFPLNTSFIEKWFADFETTQFRTYDGSFLSVAPKSKRISLHHGDNLISFISAGSNRAVIWGQLTTNMRFEPRGIQGVTPAYSELRGRSIYRLYLKVIITGSDYELELYDELVKVAETASAPLTQNWVKFTEVGGSGISGWFYMAYPQENYDVFVQGDVSIFFYLPAPDPYAIEKHNNLYYSVDEAGLW